MIPTVTYEERDVASLTPDPDNPRAITPPALAGLTSSIARFGPVEPIVVNRTTGLVVGGHKRLEALQKLQVKRVMVVVGEWTPAEGRVLNVTLNNPEIQGRFEDPGAYLENALQGISLTDFRELKLEAVFPREAKAKTQQAGLVYKIVVTCDDERHQEQLLERLEADGLTCSPLIA